MMSHIIRKIAFLGLLVALPVVAFCQEPDVKVSISYAIRLNQVGGKVQSNLSNLLSRINRAYIQKSSTIDLAVTYLDSKAKNDLEKLWQNAPFYCEGAKIKSNLLEKSDGDFQVRQIRIRCDGNNAPEELVVNSNANGVFNNISLAIKENQFLGLLAEIDKNDKADALNRGLILDFIENFRTAYNKKDMEFLQRVYSDSALIIVGKRVQPEEHGYLSDQYYKTLEKQSVEMIKLTKKQYLERLSEVFNKEKSINVEFNDIKVTRHLKNPNFYGVFLKQLWASSYSDEGYLFLLIQFRTNDNPLIWVRTWQDVKYTYSDEVFGLHNFIIN